SLRHLHALRAAYQAAAGSVYLVDHAAVDLPRLDVCQQALECRSVHVAAAEAAVVAVVRQADPAFGFLSGDVRLACLALGVKAVELLLQAILGALAGVDGAPERHRRIGGGPTHWRLHSCRISG